MANYELVIGSKFQPFSYERYIKPYQLYNEAYTEQENALNTLSVTSELLRERALAEKANGQEWAGKYLDYLDSLKAQADALSKEGLNVNSRRALSNLKTAYGTTVAPVQKAIEAQAALAKIAASQNPALRMQYGEMPTIDALIADPTKTQIGYSGAAVEESAAKLAAQAASRTTSDSFNAFRHYWMRHLQTVGYNQATINKFLEEASTIPELQKIYKQVTDQFGGFEGLSNTQKAKMQGEILTGILKGAGYKEVVDYKQNPIAVEQWKANQARLNNPIINPLNNLAINPLNIYNNRELSKDEKKYKENMERYSDYFYKENGQWKMNQKGWEAYNKKIKNTSGKPTVTPEGVTILTSAQTTYSDSPFKKFMDSIGVRGISSKSFGPWQGETAGAVWGRYAEKSPAAKTAKYDAMKVTEYDYPIAGAQQGDMKDAIMTAGRGLSLKEVDYDSKSKQFKDTGEEITMKDLKSDKYKVTATRFSPYGTTVMIQDDKGNVRRFRMPAGINTTNEQNRDRAMAAANQWQQVVTTGQYTDARGNIHQATPDEITYAQQQYAQAIQQAYLFHSQLGVQNKTKEQEFNPYGY